ncbi:thioesterase II family protein [Streptomyces sp. YIM 98790]|uniref:thioesterase II family protein n=1 Tax=Streptomyces sp. YIM 98790 TaxID=2689077 RepID=UPI00140B76FC|nr:alpha/beta fold hydrolase [Streptomyces sp. YIM 98790]
MEARTWVRPLHPRAVPGRRSVAAPGGGNGGADGRHRTRIVCCPHSGGWAGSFAPWRDHVRELGGEAGTPGTELLAVQYPGHGDRGAERPEGDVAAMAAAIRAELAARSPARLLLFGHSFGAIVAFETARQMEAAGTPPALLAVSGARAPGRPVASPGDARLPDEELWRRLSALGGIDPLLAEDPDVRDLVLSAVRSDIAAHERYVSAPPPGATGVDIRCYLGSHDPLVPADAGAGWRDWTTGRLVTRVLAGGHFHLFENPRPLLDDLLAEPPAHPPAHPPDGHAGAPPGERAGTEPESAAWR